MKEKKKERKKHTVKMEDWFIEWKGFKGVESKVWSGRVMVCLLSKGLLMGFMGLKPLLCGIFSDATKGPKEAKNGEKAIFCIYLTKREIIEMK